jgi:2-polyprenyl-3-methyl-5-hydroxy-6-metoxy-1,4-benzoquinol methylase
MHNSHDSLTPISGYHYSGGELGCAHQYLLPTVAAVIARLDMKSRKAFDLGCGNGSVAYWLTQRGFEATGVDPSATGIAEAKRTYPVLSLHEGSCYEPLSEKYGTFPLVVSLEVVEHVYAPRSFASCVRDLLWDGGHAIISTPYHGYWKNVALAVSGKLDAHFNPLWDHGHIKFWSPRSLSLLLQEAGFRVLEVHRVGRFAPLAKSMVVIAQKLPAS